MSPIQLLSLVNAEGNLVGTHAPSRTPSAGGKEFGFTTAVTTDRIEQTEEGLPSAGVQPERIRQAPYSSYLRKKNTLVVEWQP